MRAIILFLIWTGTCIEYSGFSSVVLNSAPENATVAIGGNITFICDAVPFMDHILEMTLRFMSPYNNSMFELNIAKWQVGVGTYLYPNISLHLNSNNVSCIITTDSGDNYTSNSILIMVEDTGNLSTTVHMNFSDTMTPESDSTSESAGTTELGDRENSTNLTDRENSTNLTGRDGGITSTHINLFTIITIIGVLLLVLTTMITTTVVIIRRRKAITFIYKMEEAQEEHQKFGPGIEESAGNRRANRIHSEKTEEETEFLLVVSRGNHKANDASVLVAPEVGKNTDESSTSNKPEERRVEVELHPFQEGVAGDEFNVSDVAGDEFNVSDDKVLENALQQPNERSGGSEVDSKEQTKISSNPPPAQAVVNDKDTSTASEGNDVSNESINTNEKATKGAIKQPDVRKSNRARDPKRKRTKTPLNPPPVQAVVNDEDISVAAEGNDVAIESVNKSEVLEGAVQQSDLKSGNHEGDPAASQYGEEEQSVQ